MKHKSVCFLPMSPRGESFFLFELFEYILNGFSFSKTKHSDETINVNVNNKAQ